MTQRKGERVSAASTYLKQARGRPNLVVRTGAHVSRLLLEGAADLAATGVSYLQSGNEKAAKLAAGGEVLLAAGAVQSPQILMLSGIGPRAHLEDHGIQAREQGRGRSPARRVGVGALQGG